MKGGRERHAVGMVGLGKSKKSKRKGGYGQKEELKETFMGWEDESLSFGF